MAASSIPPGMASDLLDFVILALHRPSHQPVHKSRRREADGLVALPIDAIAAAQVLPEEPLAVLTDLDARIQLLAVGFGCNVESEFHLAAARQEFQRHLGRAGKGAIFFYGVLPALAPDSLQDR